MTDLLDKANTQIEYARKEIAAGTPNEALPHLDKASSFIQRAAGSTAEAPAADSEAADEPLSSDMGVAHDQLIERLGFPVVAGEVGVDAATLLGAATEEQARELAFLGFFGQPGTYPGVDYSLFEQYYEPVGQPDEQNGMQSWAPKAEWAASGSGWKHYIETKGSNA